MTTVELLKETEEAIRDLKRVLFDKSHEVSTARLVGLVNGYRCMEVADFMRHASQHSATAQLAWIATMIAVHETIADKLRKELVAVNN